MQAISQMIPFVQLTSPLSLQSVKHTFSVLGQSKKRNSKQGVVPTTSPAYHILDASAENDLKLV